MSNNQIPTSRPLNPMSRLLSSMLARRFVGIIIDMCLTSFIVSWPEYLAPSIADMDALAWLKIYTQYLIDHQTVFYLLVWALFCLRDVIGRGVGRRVSRTKVVSVDGSKPRWWKLILRNITTVIWPVEALVALISPENLRLTDRLLALAVTDVDQEYTPSVTVNSQAEDDSQ